MKVFLVFSDFEKLGILGEGMFSFDLDRIFIEELFKMEFKDL